MKIDTQFYGWSIQDGDYVGDSVDTVPKKKNIKKSRKPKSAIYSIGLFVLISVFITFSRFFHNVFSTK